MLKKTNKKGFTLIELIIVVAIMAVLVALLAPNVLKYLEKSKVGKDISSLDGVRVTVEAEITDEMLYTLKTDATYGVNGDTVLDGILLKDLVPNETDGKVNSTIENMDVLGQRLFGANKGIEDKLAQAAGAAFDSKVAKEAKAEIAVYLNGEGGVVVAAVDANGHVVVYDGQALIVNTKFDLGTLTKNNDGTYSYANLAAVTAPAGDGE